ncbi:MAG: mismatch-specific DNA-glycosylase [Actinomycetia bacterium]|nr:mismatch-specific DNA-glycosylase [Actinomycetes bacterium]
MPPTCFSEVRSDEVPLSLAQLHQTMAVDEPGTLTWPCDSFWTTVRVGWVVEGAGFEITDLAQSGPGNRLVVRIRRRHSLPDTVGPHMQLLVSGLNPSPHASDSGVGFSRPGNRFWPAALDAGIVSVDRSPRHALAHHGIGMTDLVKRATRKAAELSTAEYRAGIDRLDHLCAWLEPEAVCFVGLAGWRSVLDRKATAGWQRQAIGGQPVYVMPSTSGLNASSSRADLAAHLAAAFAGPPPAGADSGP